ncbi:ABC transporter permease [Nocardiopsis changdeensis]|uniref:ABC transporter permease n=1 Tax=Nocardiopsis changdeensis TaxID=2831969 RepID=UPI003F459B08
MGESELLVVGPALAVAVVVAVAAAAGVSALGRLGHGLAVLRAGGRAVLQLGAVSFLIAAVVSSGPLTLGFVAVMLTVAALTAGRRITSARWRPLWVFLPVCLPVVPVVVALLLTGLTPVSGLAVIPLTGILTGGALTATVLAGRRATEELRTRRGEVEAALSLGLSPRGAALEIGRPAASALLPALDQTRTVGLVTLPGAFVGMLLGGATPFEAGAVQVFVLAGLLLVESLAIVLTVELVARGALPVPERE